MSLRDEWRERVATGVARAAKLPHTLKCPSGPLAACNCTTRERAHEVADTLLAPGGVVAEIVAAEVLDFAQWVASNRAYNGSDHRHGQSLYNECLNAVLPTWAIEFAALADDASSDAPQNA